MRVFVFAGSRSPNRADMRAAHLDGLMPELGMLDGAIEMQVSGFCFLSRARRGVGSVQAFTVCLPWRNFLKGQQKIAMHRRILRCN